MPSYITPQALRRNRAFGQKIRGRRTELGLRQSDLAEQVGVSRTTIVNIEQGTQGVALWRAVELAKVLRITLDELVDLPAPKPIEMLGGFIDYTLLETQ